MDPLSQLDPMLVSPLMIGGFMILLCAAVLVSSMFSDREWDRRRDRRDGEDEGD